MAKCTNIFQTRRQEEESTNSDIRNVETDDEDLNNDENKETDHNLQNNNLFNKVDIFDNLEQELDDTFDEPVLFYLLENVMERVKDDQSEEVLVLNLESDIKIVNTIIG